MSLAPVAATTPGHVTACPFVGPETPAPSSPAATETELAT
jgi:hypothetical protein